MRGLGLMGLKGFRIEGLEFRVKGSRAYVVLGLRGLGVKKASIMFRIF